MRILPTEKLVAYVVLASGGLFAALLAHRVALALVAAPFAVALVAGLSAARHPEVSVAAELSEERVIEGDEAEVRFVVDAGSAAGLVELAVHAPPALLAGRPPVARVLVGRPGRHDASLVLEAARWGTYELGPFAWRAHDPGRLLRYEGVGALEAALRVHPRPEVLRRLVQPGRTTPFGGSHTARRAGEGIEFAEVRPFVAGDRLADVNARVTARRGEPFVTLRHPERHANVVVLLDTTTEGSLEPTVRAAVALVRAYAGEHDRVGIVAFGSMVRWVAPGLGARHLYRVLDGLLASETPDSYVWRDLRTVPPRMLPPNALVWLVSPLEDDRPAGIVLQLASRGFDVSVLEIALGDATPASSGELGELAHRLWRLRRAARRRALVEMGAPVVGWDGRRSMAFVVEEAAAFRARRRLRMP